MGAILSISSYVTVQSEAVVKSAYIEMTYFGPCNTNSIESNDTMPYANAANPMLSPF